MKNENNSDSKSSESSNNNSSEQTSTPKIDITVRPSTSDDDYTQRLKESPVPKEEKRDK